jgi:hypothetical protein
MNTTDDEMIRTGKVQEYLDEGLPSDAVRALAEIHGRIAAECREVFGDTAEIVFEKSCPSGDDERGAGIRTLEEWGWDADRAAGVVGWARHDPEGLRVGLKPRTDSDWVDAYCMILKGAMANPLMHDAAAWVRRRKNIRLVKG